jgi:signal transduction histidine kinase
VFRIGSLVLTPEEVAKRKQYLEITPQDEERLREAHPLLSRQTQAIIDRFYDYLLAHDHTRRMLEAPGLVERLKGLQTQYFTELTSGVYDLAYFERRLRVGQAHHRIGLSPEWYMGAYVKYLHLATEVLRTAFAPDDEKFFQTLISLTKIISLDKALAVDAYQHAAQVALEEKSAEIERKSEEVKRSNEELRRVQAAKRQLTDMIIHDLQNPLTGVSAALQVVATGEKLPDSSQRALTEAVRRCQDLARMIMNVLQVSRAETGELETFLEDLDLSRISRDVVEAFRTAAELEGRSLVFETPGELKLRSDEALLRRILQNLIRNALRHTPKGTPVVVRLETESPERVRLSVIDSGPGIPVEAQARLFEPFGASSLRQAGLHVDTGLGLPSCRVMARAIGAEIQVESDGRKGTIFSLILPRHPSVKG